MKTRTLLIDASYLLKRSFSGNKESYTNSFGHIGGLYSFYTTLRKLIKEHLINKVILVWDGENGGIYRHRIDRKYKANRENKSWYDGITLTDIEIKREEEKRQSVLKQKIRIQQYAEELFLRQIMVDEIEADDIIAQYVIDYNEKEEIFIHTNDRDFCQLLQYNINIIFGNINTPINKNNFMMHFPYSHENALTIKIIEGDVSDNVEGITGIKTQTLIKYFPEICYKKISVRDICINAKKINEERVINKQKPYKALTNLLENTERLKLNYKLMNLSEPILNEQAIEELEQLTLPLEIKGRNSKNLYNFMLEDGFLEIYNSSFSNYIEPFYTVIMFEQDLYKKYINK
jgi:5'-3' exonuclease